MKSADAGLAIERDRGVNTLNGHQAVTQGAA
jgi:hypothetical protein